VAENERTPETTGELSEEDGYGVAGRLHEAVEESMREAGAIRVVSNPATGPDGRRLELRPYPPELLSRNVAEVRRVARELEERGWEVLHADVTTFHLHGPDGTGFITAQARVRRGDGPASPIHIFLSMNRYCWSYAIRSVCEFSHSELVLEEEVLSPADAARFLVEARDGSK
jgi:hypothetical protein